MNATATAPAPTELEGELLAALRSNQSDLFVHDAADMTALWMATYQQQGISDERIENRLNHILGYALGKAPGYAATVADGVVLARLAADMARSGNIYNTYRVVQRPNGPVIVFRGQPHLRRVLNAPVYRATNAKVIAMGVGKDALKAGARSGLVLTVVVSATARTIDWLFNDNGTIHSVLGHIATDILKGIIATGAGLLMGLALAGGAAATVAIVPIGFGIAAAVIVGFALDHLDENYKITHRLSEALARSHHQWKLDTEQVRRDTRYYFGTTEGQVQFIRFFSRGRW
jgi:hypothetical protein